MATSQLFKKPKGVRYVDMAIYIDEHIYDEEPDFNLIYQYMWLLAYMLAAKNKYFNSSVEYEEFSSYLAYSTYQRMTDKNKMKIKSVLNYMKSILYFRKAAFNAQNYQEVISAEYDNWDSIAYAEKYKSSLEAANRSKVELAVMDTLKSIPSIIKKNIPRNFRQDKLMCKNIYISSLLTTINRFTLPNASEEYLSEKLESTPTFNEVKFFRKHLDDSIILWHLPQSMESVIMVISNKVNNYLVDEIKYISQESNITDDEFNSIIATNFTTGGSNEADY